MSYSIGIDRELSVGDKVYYVSVDADVTFRDSEDPEPYRIQIDKAEVAPLEGDPMPLEYEGRMIEQVVVTGHPELTQAIDDALWEEIRSYGEDYCYEISRDLREACDERDL